MKLSIKGQGYSLTLVKGHSDFKVKCLTFGLYTQVSDSGPLGPLVLFVVPFFTNTVHNAQESNKYGQKRYGSKLPWAVMGRNGYGPN